MKRIQILVDNHEHAVDVQRLLQDGEQEGDLNFSFGLKISEDLSTREAHDEFHREARS